jgi:hypothetical protein
MIVKGQKFICKKSPNSDDFFKIDYIYEIVYVDNERERIEICLRNENKTSMIDIDSFNKMFIKYQLKK